MSEEYLENKNYSVVGNPNSRQSKRLLFGVLILAVLLFAGSVYFFFARKNILAGGSPETATSVYQAVFLSNGQVYFGQVVENRRDYLKLVDIYYLQKNDALQSKDTSSQNSSDLSLVKLGSELHGPQDMMMINSDHVLFIEDLRGDSKVMRAIREYKNQNNQ